MTLKLPVSCGLINKLIEPVARKSTIEPKRYSWEAPPPYDPVWHLRIHRRTLYAALCSVLVHALVLFVVPRQRIENGEPPSNSAEPLVVNIQMRAAPQDMPVSASSIPEIRPQAMATPPVIAANKPNSKSQPKSIAAAPTAIPTPAAADLQAYVEAARARRRAADGMTDKEYAAANAQVREPSEDEIRMAKVMRNMNPGTNGIFQIVSVESRTAAFTFRGWTTSSSNARREYIQVDIGTNSTIELAIVRKMIELIRRYYTGNFNWESQRLDRVIVLSARPEDNEGLEGFMLKEFFAERSSPARLR